MYMTHRVSRRIKAVVLTLAMALVLGLFALARVAQSSNIDPGNKFAWSSVAGWINFNPQCTGCQQFEQARQHLVVVGPVERQRQLRREQAILHAHIIPQRVFFKGQILFAGRQHRQCVGQIDGFGLWVLVCGD